MMTKKEKKEYQKEYFQKHRQQQARNRR